METYQLVAHNSEHVNKHFSSEHLGGHQQSSQAEKVGPAGLRIAWMTAKERSQAVNDPNPADLRIADIEHADED